MPHQYVVGGRTNATAATANHVAAQLWNPSTTMPIYVKQIWCVTTAATAANIGINRSTARGATPTATVTPDIDNDIENYVAPTSASVLELATFGTQPTLATPAMHRWNIAGVVGAGMIFAFDPYVKVGPGNGICLYTPIAAVFPACDVTFIWEE